MCLICKIGNFLKYLQGLCWRDAMDVFEEDLSSKHWFDNFSHTSIKSIAVLLIALSATCEFIDFGGQVS